MAPSFCLARIGDAIRVISSKSFEVTVFTSVYKVAASASETWQISAPVAGSMVTKVLPDSFAIQRLLIKLGCGNSNLALRGV